MWWSWSIVKLNDPWMIGGLLLQIVAGRLFQFLLLSLSLPVTSPHKMGGHNNGKDACSHDTARNSATLLLSDTYIPLGPTGLNASLKCKNANPLEYGSPLGPCALPNRATSHFQIAPLPNCTTSKLYHFQIMQCLEGGVVWALACRATTKCRTTNDRL